METTILFVICKFVCSFSMVKVMSLLTWSLLMLLLSFFGLLLKFQWLQEKAYEESQKYKEGMYILEKERMLKAGWWCHVIWIHIKHIGRSQSFCSWTFFLSFKERKKELIWSHRVSRHCRLACSQLLQLWFNENNF